MGERIRGRKGQKLRERRLANEPLCRICKAEGRTTAATVPDHILPLAKGGEDTDDNIRCLCADCHDRVTREEFGHKARVTIGEDGWPAG